MSSFFQFFRGNNNDSTFKKKTFRGAILRRLEISPKLFAINNFLLRRTDIVVETELNLERTH